MSLKFNFLQLQHLEWVLQVHRRISMLRAWTWFEIYFTLNLNTIKMILKQTSKFRVFIECFLFFLIFFLSCSSFLHALGVEKYLYGSKWWPSLLNTHSNAKLCNNLLTPLNRMNIFTVPFIMESLPHTTTKNIVNNHICFFAQFCSNQSPKLEAICTT